MMCNKFAPKHSFRAHHRPKVPQGHRFPHGCCYVAQGLPHVIYHPSHFSHVGETNELGIQGEAQVFVCHPPHL